MLRCDQSAPWRAGVRVCLEALERRTLLCAVPGELHGVLTASLPIDPGLPKLRGASPATFAAAAIAPALSSNPTAQAKLFLDFDGYPAMHWNGFDVPATPAYDIDGNPSSFSSAELDNITEIWERVADKYSPFNLDVTTIDPGNTNDLQTLVAVIGGNGSWLGATAGGVAYLGSFSNSTPNQVWIFPDNLGGGFAKYVAEAASHEAGHGFSLNHQSLWSSGFLIDEYNPGSGGKAPVMGNSYNATRGMWWLGPTQISSTDIQDDLAVVSGPINGFGYRADDHGGTIAASSALGLAGKTLSGTGIIERTSDVDYFYFDQPAFGPINLTAAGPRGMVLDLKLELRDAAGTLLASANTSSLGETINANLAPGRYYLAVLSKASYGDVGQYAISGSVAAANILVSDGAQVHEYTPDGTWLSSVSVPYPPAGGDGAGTTRDLLLDPQGRIQHFNGTFDPYLSTYSPGSNTWAHQTYSGWSTVNNVSYGGIGAVGNYIFVTDMTTGGADPADAARGIVRFDTALSSAVRFADTTDYIDLTIGLDGLLYALASGGNQAHVFDPATLALQRTVNLATAQDNRAIAVDLNGDIFVATWSGRIYRTTSTGAVSTFLTVGSNLADIDLINAGTIIAGTYAGNKVIVTDRALAAATSFAAGTASTQFVAFGTFVSTVPSAPASLTAGAISSSQIALSWQDSSGNESGFKIERSTNGTSYTLLATVGADVTSYTDLNLSSATLYYYRVRATNALGDSGPSPVASARTLIIAPSDLAAAAISNTQIKLTWKDNSSNESGFQIERSTDGVNFTQIATVGASVKTYTNSSLAPNTIYYYRVRAYNSLTNSLYTPVSSARTYLLVTPTGVSAKAISMNRIDVSWTDNNSAEDGYRVEVSPDNINFAPAGTTGANVKTLAVNGLSPDTRYYFRVQAFSAAGTSAFSTVVNTKTTYIPAAPSNLTATPFNNSQINLAWTDNSNNESGFKIERSTDGANFTQIATTGANAKTYSSKTLAAGTKYYYRVRAYNSVGENSDYSNIADAITATSPPAAPTSLTATPTSSSQINLAWVDKSNDETGFKIERSTDGENFTQIATVGANVKTYSSTGLSPATTYYFRVRAYSTTLGDSLYSNTASNTTYAVNAPLSLTTKVLSSTSMSVTWTDNSTNENGFRIERSTDGTNYVEIGTVGANIKTNTTTDLNPNTKYYFRARAYNDLGVSPYSNVASGTTTYIPAAPSNLSAAPTGDTNTQILLNWTDNAVNESGFKIERGTDGVNFAQIATVSANVKSYTSSGLTYGTSYYFRVRAYNSTSENSDYSNVADVTTTSLLPAKPATLTATTVSNSQISLAWTDSSNNESGFKIERSTDGVSFTQIATTAANVKSYTSSSLNAGTMYSYRVRAYNGAGDGEYSDVAAAVTKPATPTGLVASALPGAQIRLTWNDVIGETNYYLERSLNGTSWSELVVLDANATSFVDSGLTAGTRYYYRLRAANAGGYSGYSSTVNVIAVT